MFDSTDHRGSDIMTFGFAANISPGATLSALNAMPGLQEYDAVVVGLSFAGPHATDGLQFTAFPAAANSVRLSVHNPGTGTVALGAVTCRISVLPRDIV